MCDFSSAFMPYKSAIKSSDSSIYSISLIYFFIVIIMQPCLQHHILFTTLTT